MAFSSFRHPAAPKPAVKISAPASPIRPLRAEELRAVAGGPVGNPTSGPITNPAGNPTMGAA